MSNTRDNLLAQYCAKKREHDELEKKLKDGEWSLAAGSILDRGFLSSNFAVRFKRLDMQKEYDKTDDWLKAIQSVGQMIGEVLMEQEGGEKCKF